MASAEVPCGYGIIPWVGPSNGWSWQLSGLTNYLSRRCYRLVADFTQVVPRMDLG